MKRGVSEFGEARVVNVASLLHDPEASKRTSRQKDIGTKINSCFCQDESDIYVNYIMYILTAISISLSVLEEVNTANFNFDREGSYTGINAYMNSKQALIMFSHSLARKLQDTGVTVNALCPG